MSEKCSICGKETSTENVGKFKVPIGPKCLLKLRSAQDVMGDSGAFGSYQQSAKEDDFVESSSLVCLDADAPHVNKQYIEKLVKARVLYHNIRKAHNAVLTDNEFEKDPNKKIDMNEALASIDSTEVKTAHETIGQEVGVAEEIVAKRKASDVSEDIKKNIKDYLLDEKERNADLLYSHVNELEMYVTDEQMSPKTKKEMIEVYKKILGGE